MIGIMGSITVIQSHPHNSGKRASLQRGSEAEQGQTPKAVELLSGQSQKGHAYIAMPPRSRSQGEALYAGFRSDRRPAGHR